ncbi:hypothetical protein BC629DRAFT_153777 [Irpex lacteus]|nr:hypothetical protein BC629DRAFT_153777 [Irpex lacteus]
MLSRPITRRLTPPTTARLLVSRGQPRTRRPHSRALHSSIASPSLSSTPAAHAEYKYPGPRSQIELAHVPTSGFHSTSAPQLQAQALVAEASNHLDSSGKMVTSLDSATAATMKGRTLVLCFDGTSNQYDGDNTNVVKFYSLLKKNITDEQLCYYQPGVGTYFQPGVVAPVFQWCAKIMDEAVAWYLDAHVRGGYTFLMQNWRPGDKICIFGFSRGAYTARALAGFIHKIGLLPKDNPEQVPLAYKMFKKTDPASVQLAAGFKQTFCRSVQIEFVGVWDTVASVGLLMSKTLPFTTTNTTIKTFRHALSLDERRAKFLPNLYHRLSPDATRTVHDLKAEMGIDDLPSDDDNSPSPSPASPTSISAMSPPQPLSPSSQNPSSTGKKPEKRTSTQGVGTPPGYVRPRGIGDAWRPFPNVRRWARRGSHKRAKEEKEYQGRHKNRKQLRNMSAVDDPSDDFVGLTDVLEVWFAGGHGNVGGGSTANSAVHALSDIPLRWMVRQVVQAQCGIQFDNDAIARAGIPLNTILGTGFVAQGLEVGGITTTASPESASLKGGQDRKGKVQPTLHFFAEPKEKRETLKAAVNGPGKDHVDVGISEVTTEVVGSSTDETNKVVRKPVPPIIGEGDEEVRKSEDSGATHSSTGTEIDAMQAIDDELVQNKWWWILEVVPTSYTYQDGRGEWHTKWGLHLGRGRHIPDNSPKFHESVKERMENQELKYTPRASWNKGTETYVS